MIGPSETVPLKDGRLLTGTWQQFVLVDFDDTPRERTVMVQVSASRRRSTPFGVRRHAELAS